MFRHSGEDGNDFQGFFRQPLFTLSDTSFTSLQVTMDHIQSCNEEHMNEDFLHHGEEEKDEVMI